MPGEHSFLPNMASTQPGARTLGGKPECSPIALESDWRALTCLLHSDGARVQTKLLHIDLFHTCHKGVQADLAGGAMAPLLRVGTF